jgi:phytoene synthase
MAIKKSDFIASYLKQNDIERYFFTLILPKKHQKAVQTLLAFNAEVSSISLKVKEPASGEIRLVWWREILEGKRAKEATQNPIANDFLAMLKDYNLPTAPLIKLLEARQFDLYNDKMPNIELFETYAGETSSILYQYIVMILNDGSQVKNGDAAGHIGVAHALIGHINALGFNASRSRLFLPIDVFKAHGISEQQLFEGKKSEHLDAAIMVFCELAQSHLEKGRAAIKKLPKKLRPAFGNVSLLEKKLQLLQRQKTFALHSPNSLSNLQILVQLIFGR